jgi:hypothetical protein
MGYSQKWQHHKIEKRKTVGARSDFGLGFFAILWQIFFEKKLGK